MSACIKGTVFVPFLCKHCLIIVNRLCLAVVAYTRQSKNGMIVANADRPSRRRVPSWSGDVV